MSQTPETFLPFDPGRLPTRPAPHGGQRIELRVDGYPPVKTLNESLRNPEHRWYRRFVILREAAQEAMGGRAWSFGPIQLDFDLYTPGLEQNLRILDYEAGIYDTLDGSHGSHFTYLPIVYNDDCQIVASENRLRSAQTTRYKIVVTFL